MNKRRFYGGADPRELPLYSVGEAAHYLSVAPTTLRSWVSGRTYPAGGGTSFSEPLIRLPDEQDGRMSFNNLIEAHVLSALRRQHSVSMPAIRTAITFAERKMRVSRLLLRDELRTGQGDLFWDELTSLINLSRSGQFAIRELVEAHLNRIERDPSHLPIRLYPFVSTNRERRTIVIDPFVSFGRPTISGAGVATSVLVQRIDAGEDIAAVADDYNLEEVQVKDAILYERAA